MTDLKWTPVTIRLGQIEPWSDNPRMSTKAQAERLIQSERELGQVQTVAVGPVQDNGKHPLYDGHQRVSAWYTVKGADFELTALQSNRPLTEDERRKMAVLLHTATGGWNWDKLSGWRVGELKEWGLVNQENVKGWNTDALNVKELLKAEQEVKDAEPQIDRAAELLEKWGVKPGDLWQIGEHRLLCGDSTKREDVERVMGGDRAQLSPTDPPYNVGIDYDNNKSDQQELEEYRAFSVKWFSLCREVSDILVFTPGRGRSLINIHLWFEIEKPLDMAIWVKKNSTTHGSLSHFMAWEAILVYGTPRRRPGQDVYDYPIINQFSDGVAMTDYHPTPKNIKLWESLIDDYSEPGDVIFEPFSGSGTTLVACENKGRRCRAIEFSPSFVAVNLERMAQAFPELEIKRL